MDPVITAIIATITAGVITGAGDVAKQAVSDLYAGGKQVIIDSYNSLKSLLKHKFGEQSDVVKSVNEFEVNPELTFKKEALKHYLSEAKVADDPTIKKAAEDLLVLLKALPQGEQLVQTTQTAIGEYIAQAANHGIANVNIGKTEK